MEVEIPFVTQQPEVGSLDPAPDRLSGYVDEDESEDENESSGCSESSSEDEAEIDEVVREDMAKLEHVFHDMGLKFRMINRIGEGTFLGVLGIQKLSQSC